jgi:peptidyl-prolyl cis-trans isomerase B (cyclophilin B)
MKAISRVDYAPNMKPQKAIHYVRQRTVMQRVAYVRSRTIAIGGVVCAVALAACNSNTAPSSTPGLVTIQTAVTCPAPPVHIAVAKPPRSFAAEPHFTLGHDVGYCAYIDTAAGVISIRLRPEYAPHAVTEFIALAQRGFYDGLSFYQVCPVTTGPACAIPAPVALAGDPTAAGTGGPGYTVVSDPVIGNYLFGAVAMYTSNPETIGSQFFISRGDSSDVARKYDIFGQVTDGFSALTTLQKGTTIVWVAIATTAPEP